MNRPAQAQMWTPIARGASGSWSDPGDSWASPGGFPDLSGIDAYVSRLVEATHDQAHSAAIRGQAAAAATAAMS